MKKFLILVLTLFISSFIYAAPSKNNDGIVANDTIHQHYQKMKQDFEKIIKELNVSDKQKEQMKETMQADISRKKELRQQIRQKSDLIDEELLKENIDTNTINNLTTEIQQLTAEISKINIESKLKVRSILSFKQYTKMEQNRKETMKKIKQEKTNTPLQK